LAVLDSAQLETARRTLRDYSAGAAMTKTKTQINTAVQAAEDWFETNKASLVTAVQASVTPNLTAAQARLVIRAWILHKMNAGVS
jgi:hypothetical protein